MIPAGAGQDLLKALGETGWMVGLGLLAALLLGLPLGLLLLLTRRGCWGGRGAYQARGLAVNLVRSLPFVILLRLALPLARLLTGKGTGPLAASVPLAIASVAFYARLAEGALAEVGGSVLEAARVLGAGPRDVLWRVLLPDALPGLLRGYTVTAISLVGDQRHGRRGGRRRPGFPGHQLRLLPLRDRRDGHHRAGAAGPGAGDPTAGRRGGGAF